MRAQTAGGNNLDGWSHVAHDESQRGRAVAALAETGETPARSETQWPAAREGLTVSRLQDGAAYSQTTP